MKKIILTLGGLLATAGIYAQTYQLSFDDTRLVSTTPSSYASSFQPHFKAATAMGLPAGSFYYSVLGLRGWGSDNSGGKAYELAFGDNDNVFLRSGFSPTWEAWRKFVIADLNGNISTTGTTETSLTISDTGGAYIRLYQQATDSYIMVKNALRFYNGDTEKARITAAGNLLVGKTSQSNSAYKVDVGGTIRANEIVVNTTGADFVFEEGYKVRKLEEVESFIKANKHLPDIPPAKAMQEEGVGVSELQTKLLQKIEELTLYIIEQDKKNKQLEDRIKKLELNNK